MRYKIAILITGLIAVFVVGLSLTVTAQNQDCSPDEVCGFFSRDTENFVLYIQEIPGGGTVSLERIRFESVAGNVDLLSYFQGDNIDWDNVQTPACFQLIEPDSSRPLPNECPEVGEGSYVSDSIAVNGYFWRESENRVQGVSMLVDGQRVEQLVTGDTDGVQTFRFSRFTADEQTQTAASIIIQASATAIIVDTCLQNANEYASITTTWTPCQQTFEDGLTMVLVPRGNDTDPVWIDLHELSQQDYARIRGLTPETSRLPQELTAAEAEIFCAARGENYRLPTYAEWAYAALSDDGRTYPWGNAPSEDLAVYNTDAFEPVNARSNGASWVGAVDMFGNVEEWVTADGQVFPVGGAYSSTEEDLILRSAEEEQQAYARNPDVEDVGGRCVRVIPDLLQPPTDTPTPAATLTPTGTVAGECVRNIPNDWRPYSVQINDSLSRLVEGTGWGFEQVAQRNCIDPNRLFVGQVIFLPPGGGGSTQPDNTSTPNPDGGGGGDDGGGNVSPVTNTSLPPATPSCGNNICEIGEDEVSCPSDCPEQ